MSPAEYARSQGWRVGDLLMTFFGALAAFEIKQIAPSGIWGDYLCNNGLRGFALCGLERESNWRRIGRVLRPTTPAPADAGRKEGE